MFEKILAGRPARVQQVAKALRKLVLTVHPEADEEVWEKEKNAGYGVGPKKKSVHFCWIRPHSGHVELGFNQGAHLEDPAGLLEGTDENFRQLKLRQTSDLANPALKALLEQAVQRTEPVSA